MATKKSEKSVGAKVASGERGRSQEKIAERVEAREQAVLQEGVEPPKNEDINVPASETETAS